MNSLSTRLLPLLASLIIASIPWAQDGSSDPSGTPPAHFEELAFLVGPTWVAEFPGGGATDTQRFEWMVQDRFLRNVHHVTDAQGTVVYEGETVYAWDETQGRILWWYFNSTGGYLTGDAVVDGDRVHVTGTNHAGGNQTEKVKSEMGLGDGEWTSTSFFWKDGDWAEPFRMTFRPVE